MTVESQNPSCKTYRQLAQSTEKSQTSLYNRLNTLENQLKDISV